MANNSSEWLLTSDASTEGVVLGAVVRVSRCRKGPTSLEDVGPFLWNYLL